MHADGQTITNAFLTNAAMNAPKELQKMHAAYRARLRHAPMDPDAIAPDAERAALAAIFAGWQRRGEG